MRTNLLWSSLERNSSKRRRNARKRRSERVPVSKRGRKWQRIRSFIESRKHDRCGPRMVWIATIISEVMIVPVPADGVADALFQRVIAFETELAGRLFGGELDGVVKHVNPAAGQQRGR